MEFLSLFNQDEQAFYFTLASILKIVYIIREYITSVLNQYVAYYVYHNKMIFQMVELFIRINEDIY